MHINIPAHIRSKGFQVEDIVCAHGINNNIEIEAPCIVQATSFIDTEIKIGAFSGVYGGRLRHINVGRYCSIGKGLQTGWDEHPIDRITSSMTAYVPNIHYWPAMFGVDIEKFRSEVPPVKGSKGITKIGNDVWIGLDVYIASGVKIGNGAVVAAGSVVVKDVEPFTIVGGNPCRVIRQRFDAHTVSRIETLQWWRYNIYDMPFGLLHDPNAVLGWLERSIDEEKIAEFKPELLRSEDISAFAR